MSEEAFATACKELILAIERETKPKASLPGFILLYTAMDVISALSRPLTQLDTSGEVFKALVRDYMFPNAIISCDDEDLWAARCGLLHTFTVQSRNSRTGKAREIHYISDPTICEFCQAKIDPKKATKVFVVPDFLIQAFYDGVQRFIQKVQTDDVLKSIVLTHADELVLHVRDFS